MGILSANKKQNTMVHNIVSQGILDGWMKHNIQGVCLSSGILELRNMSRCYCLGMILISDSPLNFLKGTSALYVLDRDQQQQQQQQQQQHHQNHQNHQNQYNYYNYYNFTCKEKQGGVGA